MSDKDDQLNLINRASMIEDECERIFSHYDKNGLLDELPSILGNALARLWVELGWDREDLLDFVDENYCGYKGIEIDEDGNEVDTKTAVSLGVN